jgi:hypothetical protein
MASVHERTIPTERPPLVGEVSANFCGINTCSVNCKNELQERISEFEDTWSMEDLQNVF